MIKMGLWDWLLTEKEDRLMTIRIPSEQYSAIKTLIYMDKDRELTRDEVIIEALDMYLKKKLWVTQEKTEHVTQIKRATTFRTGSMAQSKNK